MIETFLFHYGKKAFEWGVKTVNVWVWVLALCFFYGLYGSIMWYEKVQENARLSVQLLENKAKIDALKINQKRWKSENEALRTQVVLAENQLNTLDKKLMNDLRNDKDLAKNYRDDSDDNALRKFTKRHGVGTVRYTIRLDSLKNAKGNQSK